MPHNFDRHGHCDEEGGHHDHHDHHDEHESSEGPADNLYARIDLVNTVALNIVEDTPISNAIKPWHLRMDETKARIVSSRIELWSLLIPPYGLRQWIQSDADDQIIVRVNFTGSVKLRSFMLKCGPEDHTPDRVLLYSSESSPDFSDISDRTPTQEFAVPQTAEVGEHVVKTAKFSNISSLTLFFPASQGACDCRISYLGFRGTWTQLKREPVVGVYESHANVADHTKIQGLEGVGSHCS